MENKDFTVSIVVEKPVHEVYNTIKNEVNKWWGGKDLSGSTSALNDEFTIYHPGAHFSKQKLVELIPDKKIVWLVTGGYKHWLQNKGEWHVTTMVW